MGFRPLIEHHKAFKINSAKGAEMLNRREFLKLTGAGLTSWYVTHPLLLNAQTVKEVQTMSYTAKDYSKLVGMEGFSEALLKNHFALYQGYVTNTNRLLDTLSQMMKDDKTGTPEFAEIKRRFGWEFNDMRLHEYYFENLGGKGAGSKKGGLGANLAIDFGSFEKWEKDFKATGIMRGIGWVILYQDITNGKLMNFWIDEHDVGHPAGCNPILILDVFEHAFMIDYGLKRADYIEAFFKNINWSNVEMRLR